MVAATNDYGFSQISGSLAHSQIAQNSATNGQVLTWNSSTSLWGPATPASVPVASVFGRTGAVVAAANDYSFSQISGYLAHSQIAQNSATNGQVLGWTTGTGWGPVDQSGAGGSVTSFNSRTGAVTPATNDYSFSQISGSVAHSQIAQNSATNGQVLGWTTGTGWGPVAAGTGDASTNASVSVDGEIALFSSTTGKILKRATGSGYVKVSSGVMGTPAAIPLADLPAEAKVRVCEIVIGDPGAASSALANDNDTPFVCGNLTGATLTLSKIECQYLPTGGTAPTVNVAITGGSNIATSNLTCGSGSFANTTTLSVTSQTDGQSLDGNLIVAGGTATYVVIRVTRTL